MGTFYTGDHPNPKARQIINTLSKVFKIKPSQFASLKVQKRQHDPFKTLVVTILSQNCTDGSAGGAFEKLEEAIGGISPEKLSAAPVQRIRNAIAIGGLQWHKAPALRQLSRTILEQYAGDLDQILSKPFDEARELLMDLPPSRSENCRCPVSHFSQPADDSSGYSRRSCLAAIRTRSIEGWL